MGARFLSENFFNSVQFSTHTITAEEEASGSEPWRVGTGRRVGGTIRNLWTPTTSNSVTWIQVQCGRLRGADTMVIDRGHNLAGKVVTLQISNDNFTTTTNVLSVTVPTTVVPNSRLTDNPGVRTEEGAFVIGFDLHAAIYWRLSIPAMGANLKPQIPGLYLGLGFSPAITPPRPWDDESRRLDFDEIKSPALWVGASRKASRNESVVTLRMNSEAEHDKARYHLGSLYWRGELMWNIPDTDQAERAWLAYAPSGLHQAVATTDYPFRTISLAMLEHEPKDN